MDVLLFISSVYLLLDFCIALDLSTFCNDKLVGNHYHPEDCHKFLSCVTGNPVPYETGCPASLVYDQNNDRCDYRSDQHKCTAEEVLNEGGTETTTIVILGETTTYSDQLTTMESSIETTQSIQSSSTPHHATATASSVSIPTRLNSFHHITTTTNEQPASSTSTMQQTTELTQQNAGTNSLATSTGVTFAYSNEPLTSTAANSNLTNTNLCICPCEYETLQEYWRNETVQRLHWERLPFKLEELKRILRVNTSELTSRRIKKISAPDHRPSSQGLGMAGAFLIAASLFLVVLMDISNFSKCRKHRKSM